MAGDRRAPRTRWALAEGEDGANVSPYHDFPETRGRRFGMIVESLGGQPIQIVVERAMYPDAPASTALAGASSPDASCLLPDA